MIGSGSSNSTSTTGKIPITPLTDLRAQGFLSPPSSSHVLVEESPEFRRYTTNPYFFIVDTAGNQLPYYNEAYEIYSEDEDVTILKLINGELDYRNQTLALERYSELKQNEANGNYRMFLPPGVGETVYYVFNQTHQDPEMAKIFGDLRFRQAMSLAMNREEIKELVYLGQGRAPTRNAL